MAAARGIAGAPLTAASFNDHADRLDNLGMACSVRRTATGVLNPNTDYVVPWHAEDFDTQGGGMWDPASPNWVRIRVAGTYLIVLQLRFGFASTGSPYNTGQRAGKVMLNGSNPNTNAVGSDKKAWSVDGEGVTLSITRQIQCNVNDLIFANCWSSAASAITALQTDFGGTCMSVSYQSPLS